MTNKSTGSIKFKAIIDENSTQYKGKEDDLLHDEVVDDIKSQGSNEPKYQLYPRRWLILSSFFLINLLQCISWMCVSVLIPEIESAFSIKKYEVNLAITMQQFFLIPGFILSAHLYNVMELRTVQMISALMTLFGGWLRMMIVVNGNFWWVVAGCTVVGSAAPFQMGGLSIIANYWFGDAERGKNTSIMTISNPIGMLVGFAI
jgi:predicted MFS family arabinose efflux permease